MEGGQEGNFFNPEGEYQETKKAKPAPKKSTGSFKAQKKLDQGMKVQANHWLQIYKRDMYLGPLFKRKKGYRGTSHKRSQIWAYCSALWQW